MRALLLLPGAALGCTWCNFHGNAQHTGAATNGKAAKTGGAVAWTTQLNGTIASSPVVGDDGTVYVGSQMDWTRYLPYHGGGLFALDGTTGAVKWFFGTNDSVSTTPAIHPTTGDVYFGCDRTGLGEGDEALFFAVDGATGEEKWRYATGCERPPFDPDNDYCTVSSPVADEDRVYFGSGDETHHALDAKTGDVAWKFEARHYDGADHPAWDGNGAALSEDGSLLFVSQGTFEQSINHTLWALNAEDGTVAWKYEGSEEAHCHTMSSPATANGLVYMSCSDAHTYAFKATTGEQVWAYNTVNFMHTAPVVSADGTQVVFGEFQGLDDKTYAVDAKTGLGLWNFSIGISNSDPAAGLATLADGSAIVFSEGAVYALSSEGKVVWRHELGDALGGDTKATSAAVTADNMIIVATNGEVKKPGKVIALKAA